MCQWVDDGMCCGAAACDDVAGAGGEVGGGSSVAVVVIVVVVTMVWVLEMIVIAHGNGDGLSASKISNACA